MSAAGLIIEYTYEGDEGAWRASIEAFVGHIRADPRLEGRFSYMVVRKKDDPTQRVHMPRWDSEETLKHVQSQPWFGEFAQQVKAFAGDTLRTTPVKQEFDSATPDTP